MSALQRASQKLPILLTDGVLLLSQELTNLERRNQKRRGAGSETPTAPFLVFRSVRKDSLLKPCSTFPAVLAPPYSWSFLERLRSNRTGKQEGKESSASPSAPGPSPADPAEMTGRGLAEF